MADNFVTKDKRIPSCEFRVGSMSCSRPPCEQQGWSKACCYYCHHLHSCGLPKKCELVKDRLA